MEVPAEFYYTSIKKKRKMIVLEGCLSELGKIWYALVCETTMKEDADCFK